MGFVNRVVAYSAQLTADYDATMEALRTAASDPASFKTDMLVGNSLKLWFKSIDGWCNLFSGVAVEPAPIALFDVTTSTKKKSVAIDVPAVDPKTLEPTDILPLGSATGQIPATDVKLDYPRTGILIITLDAIDKHGLSKGMYQGIILTRTTPSADPAVFASITVRVS